MHRFLPANAALVVALVASPGAAQEFGVETRARGNADPTATGTVVPLAGSDDAGEDLAGALDDVPGVRPRSTSWGQTAYATIRGGSARQVWVEWEGLKLAPPFGPGFDLSSTTLLGLDEVVVWRGAASTFRGSGALTGALQFRTRHRTEPGFGVRSSATLGWHDDGVVGTGIDSTELRTEAAVATHDDLSVRIGAATRRSSGAFLFDDEQGVEHLRLNNQHQRLGLFASVEQRADAVRVRATTAYDGGSRGTPGLSEFQEQFRGATLQDHRIVGLLRVDAELTEALHLHGVAGHQARRSRYQNPDPYLGSEPIDEPAESTTSEGSAGATYWGDSHTFRADVDLRSETWTSEQETFQRLTTGLGVSEEVRFAEDRVGVWAAGRAEAVEDAFAVNPGIGAFWAVASPLLLRANGGRTWRAPDLDELYLRTESVRGNDSLVAESAWSGEIAVDLASQHLVATVAYFERRAENEIVFLPVTAYLIEAQNLAGTSARGVELQIDGDIARRVFGSAQGAWVDARQSLSEAPVPLQPALSGSARLEVELGADSGIPLVERARKLRLVAEVDARGRLPLDAFGNRFDEPASFVDFGLVGGPPSLGWSIFVRNVLDARGAVDSLQQPLPGRTLWATIVVGEL